MPILTNHRDAPDQVLQRVAQQDPWVLYLVVRQDVTVRASEVLLAAAQATMRCVEVHAQRPAWADAFRAWAERSFRKVSLRAKGAAWAKLAAYDAGIGQVGEVEVVRALPPRLRSACDARLRNLQVYHPDTAGFADAPPAVDAATEPAMTFVFNPRATMSVGKQVAQVAHAVLMCAWSPLADDPRYRDAFAAWRAQGRATRAGSHHPPSGTTPGRLRTASSCGTPG
jgi:peptidyl-tRNA hydrolase